MNYIILLGLVVYYTCCNRSRKCISRNTFLTTNDKCKDMFQGAFHYLIPRMRHVTRMIVLRMYASTITHHNHFSPFHVAKTRTDSFLLFGNSETRGHNKLLGRTYDLLFLGHKHLVPIDPQHQKFFILQNVKLV